MSSPSMKQFMFGRTLAYCLPPKSNCFLGQRLFNKSELERSHSTHGTRSDSSFSSKSKHIRATKPAGQGMQGGSHALCCPVL